MFKTVKRKLIISIVFFIVICVAVPVYLLIQQFENNFNQRTEVFINATFEMFKNQITIAMEEEDKNVQQVIDNLSANNNIYLIRIFAEDGKITYSTDQTEIDNNISIQSPLHKKSLIPEKRITKLDEREGLYSVTEMILNEEQCRSCHEEDSVIAFIDVDLNLTKAETFFFTGSNHMLFVAIAGIIFLAISLIILFNKMINKPLANINAALNDLETGNYQISLPKNRSDEFGLVYNHFNNMVDQINSSRLRIEELHFERLQRLNRLKILGELTSQTAHEINNLSAIIMTRADYFKMESEENKSLENYKEDIDVILNQTKKLSLITNNILRHSKKSTINYETVKLVDLISNSIQLLKPIFSKKNIEVEQVIEESNLKIYADPIQIEQVLINLLNNSIDAIEKSGLITIRANKINNVIELKIVDNGSGIKEEHLDQIFSPFFTHKEKDKGSGLGLYIVKQICDAHKINIICESKINTGTTFTLLFESHET